jgi:porin
MTARRGPFLFIGIFLSILIGASYGDGQDPTPSPSPDSSAAKADAKSVTKTAADATAPQPPEPQDVWHRDEATGDWGGVRSHWSEKGVDLDFKLFGFVQGTTSGGIVRNTEWNGKLKSDFKFDFGKIWGWKFWSADVQTEVRFGGPSLGGIGAFNPVNTSMIIPGSDGTVLAVTAANVTKLFPVDLKKGNLVAVSVGRYNLLSLLDEDFFAGNGEERFWNVANIGPLTVLRQVPLITNGASFAYVRHGQPFITFALIDPNDHSTNLGLKDLFADGVTFYPGIDLPTKWFGKTGLHSFSLAVTTKKYTPFDEIRQVIIPGPPTHPLEPKAGSWSVAYVGRQYIVERGKRDGWGAFWQVSFADKERSPITQFYNIGIGGNGLFKARETDEFGLAYSYTGLSSVLKDNIDLVTLGFRRPRAEHVLEAFYNFHMTPWFRLTPDLQIIRPTRAIANVAVVLGGRMEVIF